MKYLNNLLHYLFTVSRYYPLQIILIIIILIFSIIIIMIFSYQNKNIDYKIYNFRLNNLAVTSYIFIFILAILYLRYLRWGFKLELIPLYKKWFLFFTEISPLLSILFIQVLLLTFFTIIKIKNALSRELWKRHLYTFHESYNKTIKSLTKRNINPLLIPLEKEYSLYNRFCIQLSFYWSYPNVIYRIQYYFILQPYCTTFKIKQIPLWLHEISLNILKYLPLSILCSFLYYDLLHNNYILHYIFYYLPFYFMYSLWKTLSSFLRYTDKSLDFIIYERYYEEDNVLYINTTEEEEEILLGYIKRGFICYQKDLDVKNIKEWEFFTTFPIIFKQKHRFTKDNEGLFINNFLGEYFDPKNIIIHTDKKS